MVESPSDVSNPPAAVALVVPHCWVCGRLLQALLSRAAYSPVVVRGGEAAVMRGLELRPTVVFIDLNMPDGDGLEVGSRLCAGLGEAVRLIAVVPAGWAGEPIRLADAGFDGMLRKPFQAGELLRLLRLLGGQEVC